MAILTEQKSGVLEEAARREEERLVRIAEGQARLFVAVIERYFGGGCLMLGPAARQMLVERNTKSETSRGTAPRVTSSPLL